MANRKNANGSTEKKSRKPKRKGHGPRENQTTADDLCLLDSEEYMLIEDRLVQTNPTLFCSVTIEYKGYRFVIIERPTEKNFAEFVEIINKRGIKYIARCSEPEISAERLEQIGVHIIVNCLKFELIILGYFLTTLS
ncbi:hypothetical protein RF11_08378 [Thelohanellus kitauei]|uniref:Uncharacterized protein n=1 Tax=Thelohanellus kitauei TaxID=669202 RepID=A0A0C2IPY9_THEKT|nr:hypothetical protein RF11_08378 [Thelohanellus kitauei]